MWTRGGVPTAQRGRLGPRVAVANADWSQYPTAVPARAARVPTSAFGCASRGGKSRTPACRPAAAAEPPGPMGVIGPALGTGPLLPAPPSLHRSSRFVEPPLPPRSPSAIRILVVLQATAVQWGTASSGGRRSSAGNGGARGLQGGRDGVHTTTGRGDHGVCRKVAGQTGQGLRGTREEGALAAGGGGGQMYMAKTGPCGAGALGPRAGHARRASAPQPAGTAGPRGPGAGAAQQLRTSCCSIVISGDATALPGMSRALCAV
jgi:hypothetical protein